MLILTPLNFFKGNIQGFESNAFLRSPASFVSKIIKRESESSKSYVYMEVCKVPLLVYNCGNIAKQPSVKQMSKI